jgi:chlorite dismutase
MVENKRQYVNYTFYKVDPSWRRLSEDEKARGRREFLEVIEGYSKRIMVFTYSTFGFRPDSDFMIWRVSYDIEDFERMSHDLYNTGFGKYLLNPYSFLSMTKHSIYVSEHFHEGQEGTRLQIIPSQCKYIFVYPFTKTADWYMLPFSKRQRMMNEHIELGHKYPNIKINTSYSFGLDDQEFVVAFETDEPADFLDLVMEMREQDARVYTERDIPIFTCIKKEPGELVELVS